MARRQISLYEDNTVGGIVTSRGTKIAGGEDVYMGSYGLEWNETTDKYTRVGSLNYTAIQSQMRRCVLNADGSVNYYLDAMDSTKKIDGSPSDLTGADGNVMVEVPLTYLKYTYTTTGGNGSDTTHRWEISQTPGTRYEVHWAFTRGPAAEVRDYRYYPAYLGYSSGGKLISRSGVYPTVSQTLAQFRVLAQANGGASGVTANGYWGQIDFALYELITLFAMIEYGTMDIQSALGQGRTALTGGTWVNGSLIGVNGLSNALGNRSGNYTYAGSADDAAADLSYMSYRGCENLFGNVWRMADGVIFKNAANAKTMWYSTNPADFNADGIGYTQVPGILTAAAAAGYARKLGNTSKGFVCVDVADGTSGAGTTDYYYTSTTDNTLALVGGTANDGLRAGPLYLNVSNSAASCSHVSVGAGVSF